MICVVAMVQSLTVKHDWGRLQLPAAPVPCLGVQIALRNNPAPSGDGHVEAHVVKIQGDFGFSFQPFAKRESLV